MNSSGSLFGDLAMVCFFIYVFNGGWLATLTGWIFCFVGRRYRERWVTLTLAAACLAPIGYIFALGRLAATGPNLANSDLAAILGVAGFAVSALIAPVAAFATFWRGTRA